MPISLSLLPPWLVLASLLGIINAAACYMLVGRHVSRVTWYALLGLFAAVSADMGVVEVLNTVAKAFVVAAAVVFIFPEWGRLLPWRVRSCRQRG